MVAGPAPLAAEVTVSQSELLLTAVQGQLFSEVLSVKLPLPPAAGTEPDEGEKE